MEEGWETERPPRRDLQPDELNHLIEPAFPGRRVEEYAVLATGLANTNIRFRMRGESTAYVLRLHTRDAAAAGRERALMSYLSSASLSSSPGPPSLSAHAPAAHAPGPSSLSAHAPAAHASVSSSAASSIPLAPLVYSDPEPERGECPYSIWGFVEGTRLQQLFTTLPPAELVDIAGACGQVLASLSAHQFPKCGELGPTLDVVREYGSPSCFVASAIHQSLFQGRAGERLGMALRDDLWRAVERTSPLLGLLDHRYTLVHGDYKRSNILMQRSGESWTVSAVLDWEFAFAGPPLVDVGLFLRAGAALPEGFRYTFASRYVEAGGQLPNDWLPLSRLLDLLSQMTFLDDGRDRPRVFAETIAVVKETLRMLA